MGGIIEWIKSIDLTLLFFINGWHTNVLDSIMLFVTGRNTWIPFYVVILVFLFKYRRQDFFLVVIVLILAVICSDSFASALMKPMFKRLRPCHDELVNSGLYMLEGVCGGKYGFISSHAANTFCLITFLFVYLRKQFKWVGYFFIWASFVSISRVYLGVHYPTDILVGALEGVGMALLFYSLFQVLKNRFLLKEI